MSYIAAGNTTTTALTTYGDTTGNLVFTTGGANTTALTLSNTQAATFANNVTITGGLSQTGNAAFSNISTTGSLGVGIATPTDPFHVQGTVNSGTVRARVQNGSTTSSSADLILNAGNNSSYIQLSTTYNSGGALLFASSLTSATINVTGAAPLIFGTGNTEKMRIDSAGYLCVGQTSTNYGGTQSISGSAYSLSLRNNQTAAGYYWVTGPNSLNHFCIFNQNNTGQYMLNDGTSWNAQSDERLKTDLTPILDGLAKVNSLRSVTGRYKTDEVGKSRSFLIAQDVQKVLPEAVSEFNGNLGVAYTDTIPLLVAAIKELNAKVELQAAEIKALKEK